MCVEESENDEGEEQPQPDEGYPEHYSSGFHGFLSVRLSSM